MKQITIKGNVNKVYLSTSVVSIEDITDDNHRNKYTSIILSNGEELQVVESKEDVLYHLNNSSSEVEFTGYEYETVFYVS